MRRRLFTFVSAVSLALFLATCAVWVRGYWVTDAVLVPLSSVPAPSTARTPFGYDETWDTRVNTAVEVASPPGVLYVRWQRFVRTDEGPPFRRVSLPAVTPDDSDRWSRATTKWRAAGFLWASRREAVHAFALFHVPFWAIAAGAAVLPAMWVRRRWGRRRGGRGFAVSADVK